MRKTESVGNSRELRHLGVLERWFWSMDKHRPAHFGITLKFKGTIQRNQWEAALSRVQEVHPLLRVQIAVTEQGKPAFFAISDQSIPFTLKARNGPTAWLEELAEQLSERIVAARAPLMRAIVLQGDNHSDLLLLFHPSIADHTSALAVAEEIILSIAGQELPQEETTPDLGALLKAICPNYSEEPLGLAIEGSSLESDVSTPTKKRTPLPQIQPYKMSRKDTAALIGRARREKVSVYSAICASLVSVYWNRLNPAEENDVRLFVPFNLRPRLGIGSNLMLALSPGLISIPHSSHSSFWQFARSLDEMVAKTHTDEHIVQTASAFGLALRYNPTPAKLAEFCDRSFGFQFLASRLKELRIKSKSAPLKLLSVWGPSILIGPPGAQSVGISTADAQLHFLLTSYEPKPAFLEDGASLLRVACDS